MTDEPNQASELLESSKEKASVSGNPAEHLSPMQREFCAWYVLNGGNAAGAAEAAGYLNPRIMGPRQLTKRRIADLVRVLAVAQLDTLLPELIGELVRQVKDPTASNVDRRRAAESLMDRAGLRRQSAAGPAVAVQINSGGANEAASVTLLNIWANRDGRMSSIAAPMRDVAPVVVEQPLTIEHEPSPADGAGGGANQGSPSPRV